MNKIDFFIDNTSIMKNIVGSLLNSFYFRNQLLTKQTMRNKGTIISLIIVALICPTIAFFSISARKSNNNTYERPIGPCDIYAKNGTPCVAAHSTTRSLSSEYNGPLYQVLRESDGKTLDIGIIEGGYADADAQDIFCKGTICRISVIYDQSGKGNDLTQAAPGTFKGPAKGSFNELPIADMAPVTINGHQAYGVYIMPGMGLRNNDARDLAINDEPEGIYYVVNGLHYDSGCCFDYGNSSTNGKAVGTGTMETTYYGTSTNWGSGNGEGPWIMADMEGGLFSGYNAKKNDVPSIDSWRYVSVFVNGGGGNKWDLRGGDATKEDLITYYSGIRPGSPNNDSYYPMNKKGGLLLGNGGDNGNGSAGTFYEGVMTIGYPTDIAINNVQKNISEVNYAEQYLGLSRLTTFTPESTQDVELTFTNSSGETISDVDIKIDAPRGWSVIQKTVVSPGLSIAPGAKIGLTYQITAPKKMSASDLNVKTDWDGGSSSHSERIRCATPVKINEVCLSGNPFIELFNISSKPIDISGYKIMITESGYAQVHAATIPENTILTENDYYLLDLSDSYLTVPAIKGDNTIFTKNADFQNGDIIVIDGEKHKVSEVLSQSRTPATIFIPVSTGPWLDIKAGANNIPVSSTSGFMVGHKMGIDLGGNYEIVTVKSIGKPGTQTNLAEAVEKGQSVIKLDATDNFEPGFKITIGTGQRKECVKIKRIIKSVSAPSARRFGPGARPHEPGEVELETPLQYSQISGVDVSCVGSGISFKEPLKYNHRSGDAVQPLGNGIVLSEPIKHNHNILSPIQIKRIYKYQNPDQYFGYSPSSSAGSIALYDKSNKVLIDAVVYGSQQSNSSANGTIASPVIATLEGIQTQGGSIAVVSQGRPSSNNAPDVISLIRIPDGKDSDNLSSDFRVSSTPTPGAFNKN